jgi:hypothetical protein
MEVHAMLALTVLIAPLTDYICAVYVDVPMINLMPVIFETIHIRITLIKVSDFSGTPNNIRVISAIILKPVITAVLFKKPLFFPFSVA